MKEMLLCETGQSNMCKPFFESQIPDVDWLVEKIQGFVDSGVLKGRHDNIWVNPGTGLNVLSTVYERGVWRQQLSLPLLSTHGVLA